MVDELKRGCGFKTFVFFKSHVSLFIAPQWKTLTLNETLYTDASVEEWCNSTANALDFRLSCTNPSACGL